MSSDAARPLTWLLLRVYLPFAAAYFLSYLYRTVNAVVGPVIVDELALSAAELGLLTSAYFIMFAGIQLPLGIALDRFGPRRVQTVLLLIAALGATLFGMGASMAELVAGRILIGMGVAAGLMGALKMIALWFRRDQWPLVNGLLMAAGGLGSLVATAPTQAALGVMSWHTVFFVLAGITVAVALCILAVAPEKPAAALPGTLREQIAAVGEIMRDGFFWRVTPLFTASQATFIGTQTLWIGPWLRDVAGQDAATRGSSMLLATVAMTAGFLTSGMAAGALAKRGIPNMLAATVSMVAFLLVTVWLAAIPLGVVPGGFASSVGAWCLFGFLGTYAIIYFPVLTGAYPLHLSGRVTTSVNFIMFSVVFLAQWGVGRVLDAWPRSASGGYDPAGYALAFGIMAGFVAVTLAWLLAFRAQPREG